MFSKIVGKILNSVIAGKIKKHLKEINLPAVSIGKSKLTILVEVKDFPTGVNIDSAKKMINEVINEKVEPVFKGVFDLEVDVKKV